MARRGAALILAMSLSVASARTLACEWVCETSTPVQTSQGCHDSSKTAVDAQWNGGHACDHGVAADVSLAVAAGSVDRFAAAFLVIAVPLRSHAERDAIHSLVALPPGARSPSSSRAAPVLRI